MNGGRTWDFSLLTITSIPFQSPENHPNRQHNGLISFWGMFFLPSLSWGLAVCTQNPRFADYPWHIYYKTIRNAPNSPISDNMFGVFLDLMPVVELAIPCSTRAEVTCVISASLDGEELGMVLTFRDCKSSF